ncbi:hypothetical protein AGMMS50268_02580 [Spirochaetia bacterium]|nr:hypothetical protein AGMMS49546_08830 [Spirochaetia bacterium]GHV89755.1 hypothetical protein AGMMS50268_02580 [Spirochaetia bacterium]
MMDVTLLDLAAALRVSADEILGIKHNPTESLALSKRWAKRVLIVEGLPEPIQKHILRTLDDVIKANTRLTIFEGEP